MNQITAGNSVSARGGAARPDGLAEGIARLRRALRRGARVADPGNPLAVAQLELLSALTEHPGARPGQLARLLHMRPNTVTTIVNTLTAQGMVSRATADGDRRAVELTATASWASRPYTPGRPPTPLCCTWPCPPCPQPSGGRWPPRYPPSPPSPARSTGSPTAPPNHHSGRAHDDPQPGPCSSPVPPGPTHPVLVCDRGRRGGRGTHVAGMARQLPDYRCGAVRRRGNGNRAGGGTPALTPRQVNRHRSHRRRY